jgi:oligopeptide transport system substrate-binding protein
MRALALRRLIFLIAGFCVAITPALAQKTLRLTMNAAESTFDPAAADDVPSGDIIRLIFDPPLDYDYTARPVKLKPSTLVEMPTVSADGRVYTLHVKPGIYFDDDPAFGGKRRELVAADYVYAVKRLIDPKVASPNYYLVEKKIVGAGPVRADAEKSGRFDYDREIPGLKTLDRYRWQITFEKPEFEFIYNFADRSFSALAHEVIEKYKDERNRVRENPIGTGAFRLVKSEWKRANRIVLERNPTYREGRVPLADGSLSEKRAPLVDRIVYDVIEEPLAMVLAFQKGQLDRLDVPRSMTERLFDGEKLRADIAKQGIRHARLLEPILAFSYFNMDDPVVGGYTLEKNALRRAILLGYDSERERTAFWKAQAVRAQQLVPPGLSGHSSTLKLRPPYDPALARALLDRFNYKDCDGDGYREAPGCKPLTLTRSSVTDSRERDRDEIWKKSMDAIGVRVEFFKQKWPDLIEMSRTGKLQSWGWSWIAGSPSGDGFVSLLVSRNIDAINDMRFNLPEYDRIYELAQSTPLGPERDALYATLSKIAAANSVLDFGFHLYSNDVTQPWLVNYVRHPFWRTPWKYVDIDEAKRGAAQ